MGIPHIKSLVSVPFIEPLPLHQSFNGRHRWQTHHRHFRILPPRHCGPHHHCHRSNPPRHRTLHCRNCRNPGGLARQIQALRTLLLGEVPPTEPTTPRVSAQCPIHEEEHVVIWHPDQVQPPTQNSVTITPTSAPARETTSAIIKDNSDDKSLPPTLLRCSPRMHATSSPTPARACLNKRMAHMINCVIADHILTDAQMPLPTMRVPNC